MGLTKSNSKVEFSRLSPDEIQNAKMILCRVTQLESYPEEYNQSKYNKVIPKNSSLLPFKPFMHESLIQEGRQIKHVDLPFNIKHQIIIYHNHQIASLILRDIHERYMHTGRHQHLIIK